MESAAALRAFQCITPPLKSSFEKPGVVPMNNAYSSFGKFSAQGLGCSWSLTSQNKFERLTVSCLKGSEATIADDSCQNGSVEKKRLRRATFPNSFQVLVAEVCDGTEIAELKLKVGDFEMHMKRNLEFTIPPPPVESPKVAPPIPGEPMNTSTAGVAPPSADKVNPFINIAPEKTAKLAALEASGATDYVIVSCPAVGLYFRGRPFKGMMGRPLVQAGDIIREGQTIGFVQQLSSILPVRSNVAGEILKIMYSDGEAIGYGDPLMAVLPSFHGIN